MSVEIVTFANARAPTDDRLIASLRWLLDAAEKGEVQALALVAMRSPDVSHTEWYAADGLSNALLGRIVRLGSEIGRALDNSARDFSR